MSDTYNRRFFVAAERGDSPQFVFELVTSVIDGPAKVSLENDTVYIRLDDAYLSLRKNSESYIVQEAAECAERFNLACEKCTVAFDLSGVDPSFYLCTDPDEIAYALLASGAYYSHDQFGDKPIVLDDVLPSKMSRLLGMLKTAPAEKLADLLCRKLVDSTAIDAALIQRVAESHADFVVDGDQIARSN